MERQEIQAGKLVSLANDRIHGRPLLIDPDVINVVILWENSVLIGISWPDASNRQVQENKMRLMELIVSIRAGNFLSTILNSIQEVVDVICIPDHANSMETICKYPCAEGSDIPLIHVRSVNLFVVDRADDAVVS